MSAQQTLRTNGPYVHNTANVPTRDIQLDLRLQVSSEGLNNKEGLGTAVLASGSRTS
jgi:hypothetical protein